MNAANEQAVADFLSHRITFPDIFSRVRAAVDAAPVGNTDNIDEILALDDEARKM